MSADNQQERLIGWILEFVDGEGCFSINFTKQPDRQERTRIRRGYKTGYQISHHFAVVQGETSVNSLYELKSYFKVGNVYINRRHDNHKKDMFSYKVTTRKDLLNVIIPFFESYELHTIRKKNDFKRFAQCVRLMNQNIHLHVEGMLEIIKITQQINHKKSRGKLIRILRDYTPNTNNKTLLRDDIVRTAWRHAD